MTTMIRGTNYFNQLKKADGKEEHHSSFLVDARSGKASQATFFIKFAGFPNLSQCKP